MRYFRSMHFFRLFRGLLLGACFWPASLPAAEPITVGWVERVKLDGLVIVAKLDTGAQTASLHVAQIHRFTRDGSDWVAFDVVGEKGEKRHFEKKVVRISEIKRLSARTQLRPTVVMRICLGRTARLTEVNLVDRTGFNYRLLLGRRFLSEHFVVDSARTYTVAPECERAASP